MLDYLYDRIAEVGASRRAPRRDELPLRRETSATGRSAASGRCASSSTTTARRRTTTGSGRSATWRSRSTAVGSRARICSSSPGQPDRLRARRARLVLAREGREARARRAPGGRRRADHPVRGGRARRGRSRRLARGEALTAAQRPRGHGVVRVLGEARLLDPGLPRRGAIARTRRATSSSGSTPASRCTATASPATGWTSATRSSSSSRTT